MLYDQNPTLRGVDKEMDESIQGQAFGNEENAHSGKKKFYIESYGCQMNFSDSEIVASILSEINYAPTRDLEKADLLLINTCSIRDKAEETVRKRLRIFDKEKRKRRGTMVGVLGCMAERLKKKFLEEEKLVDLVIGPDSYRDLPNLIATAEDGEKGINVLLSREETYADIAPLRLDSNGVCGFISIMRGCDNMCSFCVVPFTRGRERSRDPFTILSEAQDLFNNGYKEVTLLGQNVDSYKWENPETRKVVNFANLLKMVAEVSPKLRVRFSTSHPKDITNEVLYTISNYDNICKYIHLPVQSGSSRILEMMNRTYDRDWYLERVEAIRNILPDCTISTDIITGFCSETEEDHQETISILKTVRYSLAYMFYYSERPGTLAARKYEDDIPEETKKRRLDEVISIQRELAFEENKKDVGKTFEILVEGDSKKSSDHFRGRTSQNKMVIFPKANNIKLGDYVMVKITDATSATLLGVVTEQNILINN